MVIQKTLQTEEHPFQTWECGESYMISTTLKVVRDAEGKSVATIQEKELGVGLTSTFVREGTTEDQIDALTYALFGPEVTNPSLTYSTLISDYLRACGWTWKGSRSEAV